MLGEILSTDLGKDIIEFPRWFGSRSGFLLAQDSQIIILLKRILDLQKFLIRENDKFLFAFFLDDLRMDAHFSGMRLCDAGYGKR